MTDKLDFGNVPNTAIVGTVKLDRMLNTKISRHWK